MIKNIYAFIFKLDAAGHETTAQELWERTQRLMQDQDGMPLTPEQATQLVNEIMK